jgi:hypothetical protein
MIMLCESIGWVQAADGRAMPFDAARLDASILRAASQAGYEDWWLAESVTQAVHEFVCAHCDRQTVSAVALTELVEGVLGALGYKDIAEAHRQRQRCAEVRLDQMTETISELEFFHRLDTALQVVGNDELALVQVRGLRTCVMRLRGAHYWSAGCRRMAEEILGHLRERVARTRQCGVGSLRLAVVE